MGGGSLFVIDGTSSWREFYIQNTSDHKGLFDIQNCKCSCANDLEGGDDINYIGAKKADNGFMKKAKINSTKVTKGNCIIFICDGEGSVGYANYHGDDFIGSTTLSVGYNQHLNKYIGLFIVTLLDKEKYKFSYGRKYRNSLKKLTIKLPVLFYNGSVVINKNSLYSDEGYEPDWEFMENYIKNLPFGDRI